MKRYLLLVILIPSFCGCEKLDKLTQFDIEYKESVVIPSSTAINLPFNIITPDIESNSESTFAVNDTRKDLIEEIILTSLNLSLTSPENGDFGFLKSVEIYLAAEGLSEVKIAWKEDITNDAGKHLDLETSGNDLKEYIKKDAFSLKLVTVTDELLTSDYYVDIHSTFFVDAKILGN